MCVCLYAFQSLKRILVMAQPICGQQEDILFIYCGNKIETRTASYVAENVLVKSVYN